MATDFTKTGSVHTAPPPSSQTISSKKIYVFGIVCMIIGVILSYVGPLHSLSVDNNPTRHYHFDHVSTSDNSYNYADGADYQTQVCRYGGAVLVSFMTVSLLCCVLALLFALTEKTAFPFGFWQNEATKYGAILTAFASITYTISIVNWATSCLYLTGMNNFSTIDGQTIDASIFVVIMIFAAPGLISAFTGWKRQQEYHLTHPAK